MRRRILTRSARQFSECAGSREAVQYGTIVERGKWRSSLSVLVPNRLLSADPRRGTLASRDPQNAHSGRRGSGSQNDAGLVTMARHVGPVELPH